MEYQSVRITTPSRLHLTLLDLNGSLGRIDGGIGVTLQEPNIIVDGRISRSGSLEIVAQGAWEEIINDICITIYKNQPDLERSIEIELVQPYPAHTGLGSKTQLATAIAYIICILSGREDLLTPTTLASIVSRGGTSGIGYKAFFDGGFILDGGHQYGENREKTSFLPSSASKANPAVTLLRTDFPENWYFLLILLEGLEGAHDAHEVNIFQQYCPIQLEEVQKLSHLILMQTLPGLVTGDIQAFGESLYKIQSIGFKKIEVDIQVPQIRGLIDFLMKKGAYGAGMSSFGPVVYALVDNKERAFRLAQKCEEFLDNIETSFIITKASNSGAQISLKRADESSPARSLSREPIS